MARNRVRVAPSATPQAPRRVSSSRPDPLAWSTALDLAGGDARRLVVLSPTEVLVERAPRPSRAR